MPVPPLRVPPSLAPPEPVPPLPLLPEPAQLPPVLFPLEILLKKDRCISEVNKKNSRSNLEGIQANFGLLTDWSKIERTSAVCFTSPWSCGRAHLQSGLPISLFSSMRWWMRIGEEGVETLGNTDWALGTSQADQAHAQCCEDTAHPRCQGPPQGARQLHGLPGVVKAQYLLSSTGRILTHSTKGRTSCTPSMRRRWNASAMAKPERPTSSA